MIWLILGIVYGLGFLYTFRWAAGWAVRGDFADWQEVGVGVFVGLIGGIIWPFIWGYRWGYRGWVRFGPEEKDMKIHLSRLFPEPKPLETKQERNERLLKEKEAEEYRLTRT